MFKKKLVIVPVLTALVGLFGCDSGIDKPASSAAVDNASSALKFSAKNQAPAAIYEMKSHGTCSLENVITLSTNSENFGEKNSYNVNKGIAYKLIGFATNSEKGVVPKEIEIVLVGGGVYSLGASTGLERPDVAKYFNNSNFGSAGYQVDVMFDGIEVGKYAVLAIDVASQSACPTHQTINVN